MLKNNLYILHNKINAKQRRKGQFNALLYIVQHKSCSEVKVLILHNLLAICGYLLLAYYSYDNCFWQLDSSSTTLGLKYPSLLLAPLHFSLHIINPTPSSIYFLPSITRSHKLKLQRHTYVLANSYFISLSLSLSPPLSPLQLARCTYNQLYIFHPYISQYKLHTQIYRQSHKGDRSYSHGSQGHRADASAGVPNLCYIVLHVLFVQFIYDNCAIYILKCYDSLDEIKTKGTSYMTFHINILFKV